MNDFPGPWKEHKALEDQKEVDNFYGEETQKQKGIGCAWKIAIVFTLFIIAAKCNDERGRTKTTY